MAEKETNKKRRPWTSLVITTIVGVLVTLGVGFYQLSKTDAQDTLAEQERARGVKASLVSMVEEHVLNDKPISLPRLARLIDQRRAAQLVASPITLSDVIEEAEFNILKSAYLPFERKESLKAVFDTLYSELSSRQFVPYSTDTPNADLVNELAGLIQEGQSADALAALTRLQEAHESTIASALAKDEKRTFAEVIQEIIRNPLLLTFTLTIYLAVVVLMMRRGAFRKLWLFRDDREH